MEIFKEIGPLKAFLRQQRTLNPSIGLVPTMGALHNGHLALINASRNTNSLTVCSIFVNPAQFNNPADLEKYPRTPEADIRLLSEAGCNALFMPDKKEMYQTSGIIKFDFGHLDKILEGEFRPGHFSGVALVVSKLFHIVNPDRAYFGQKDFQQFRIVSQLVKELNFDLELVCAPTTREPSGLAMSSRNARLSKEERQQATIFYRTLTFAKQAIKNGKTFFWVKSEVTKMCEAENVKLEYFELADQENLNLLKNVSPTVPAVLLMAGYVGGVRLIDNMLMD